MGTLDELRDAEWRRLLAAARRRLLKTGGEPVGVITLTDPSEDERRIVARITDSTADGTRARRLTVSMSDLDRMLRRAYGIGLLAVLAWMDAPQPPAGMAAALQAALRGRHAGEGWYSAWLGQVSRDGTAARLVREGRGELFAQAGAVLDRLPAEDVPLPVLAEWATGDATALYATPLADLVLRALRLWQGASQPSDRAAERRIWNDAGVLVDDLTSQVLVLNLRVAEEHAVARWLGEAAAGGMPFRATLQQLMSGPLTPQAREVFVCQSPAVVRAAAARLGAGCAALVCTEGRASVACRRLLTAAVAAGARIRWHSDFDWAALRMTAAAVHRYAALPWRMGAEDYLEAVRTARDPLRGVRAATPWDERLAVEMAREGCAVREDRLVPVLLDDLPADTA
ncbi:TIGR02679 family protein [Actinoallomurus rhizosphaericola]|uniref:TIGR02679 family protein n=1 Tax=Actinoallomurus rhizosphaericola TaxID=2952536 RepID=UPI0020932CAB|nr:TIGR02679 family protein [Actinoallomurus rhizosphaericola]MCO5997773.1 TIGR02679 family protein [Actinoallomurus rhizosphaericola]